ncbi:MAG: thermonuclease family protein [Desulfovibrio sp.]|nr:thermonuclease family protein [Desulfovibrio sp.]
MKINGVSWRLSQRLSFFSFLFAFLLCFPSLSFGKEEGTGDADTAVVARCFDGDTVKLMDRRVVRLGGIDTPELAHGNLYEQFYARKAQKLLENLVSGKKVTLIEVSVNSKDNYGRIIADLMLEDGRSVSDTMVRQGAAFFYPHKDLLPDLQERLRSLQREAIEERAGLWAELLEHPIAGQNYIGNRDSLRFFPADCPQAQSIKPRKRVYFGTLMDAFLAGFAPSRVCPFWPRAQY